MNRFTRPLGEDRQPVPPMMGLPEERYVESNLYYDFYTCVVNGWRVFVWYLYDSGWVIQTSSFLGEDYELERQFSEADGKIHNVPDEELVTLQSVIYHLTSEGNPHARSNPAGTTESDPALSEATCPAAVR